MIGLKRAWSTHLDDQHRHPRGVIGWWIGERMRRQHAPETRWSVDLLGVRPHDHALELGFGAGHALRRIVELAAAGHVTGLDLSATMIRAARHRNRSIRAAGRLSLVRGDIEHLPFAARRFDRILSIHTFYFWQDAPDRCRHLANLLARGGRLVVTFATARTTPSGERIYGAFHERAQGVVGRLRDDTSLTVHLAEGPDSRQYNNVALVIDRPRAGVPDHARETEATREHTW